MKRALMRGISVTTRNFLHSYTKTNQNPVHSSTPLTASTRFRLRFYSSESDSPDKKKPNPVAESPSLPQAHVKDVAFDVEDVSNKGKKWVKKIGFWVSFLVICLWYVCLDDEKRKRK